jgi:hypothetical protein
LPKPKLPPATDYNARAIMDWNATSFRTYLADKHAERFGIPYVPRKITIEAKLIRNMIDEYGPEITRRFIDECFREYKPTPQYPSLNFVFMFSYMKERVIPRILAEVKRKEEREAAKEAAPSASEIDEWL